MSAAGGVGDDHPGQWLPFWRQACEEGRPFACPYAADVELEFCRQGSGWACNEAGLMHVKLSASGEDVRRSDPAGAAEPFRPRVRPAGSTLPATIWQALSDTGVRSSGRSRRSRTIQSS